MAQLASLKLITYLTVDYWSSSLPFWELRLGEFPYAWCRGCWNGPQGSVCAWPHSPKWATLLGPLEFPEFIMSETVRKFPWGRDHLICFLVLIFPGVFKTSVPVYVEFCEFALTMLACHLLGWKELWVPLQRSLYRLQGKFPPIYLAFSRTVSFKTPEVAALWTCDWAQKQPEG